MNIIPGPVFGIGCIDDRLGCQANVIAEELGIIQPFFSRVKGGPARLLDTGKQPDCMDDLQFVLGRGDGSPLSVVLASHYDCGHHGHSVGFGYDHEFEKRSLIAFNAEAEKIIRGVYAPYADLRFYSVIVDPDHMTVDVISTPEMANI